MVYGPNCCSNPKFEVAVTSGDRAQRGQSLGLTVIEAENPRSSKVVNMGVYGLALTH